MTSTSSDEDGLVRAKTDFSWPRPEGLHIPGPNDENLIIFRRALGINSRNETADDTTLELSRQTATKTYKAVLDAHNRKAHRYSIVASLIYGCYFAQIIIGAALTALGAADANHTRISVTFLGAINTVLAGILALIKGSNQPQKLGRDQVAFRKLRDWIEETEALLAVGIIGRDRKEVGMLVEVAFKKYNAAKAEEEKARADAYYLKALKDGFTFDAGAERNTPRTREMAANLTDVRVE